MAMRHSIFLIVCLLLAFTALPAIATEVTYAVDPTQSVLTASGTYLGESLQTNIITFSFNPIVYSGLSVSYGGTILANRDTTTNSITILNSNIVACQNMTLSSGPSNVPQNYFVYVNSFPAGADDFLFEGTIANLSLAISSAAITSLNSFDVSQLNTSIASGQFSSQLTSQPPADNGSFVNANFSSQLSGNLVLEPGNGSLIDVADIETLTIPINTDLSIDVNGDPLNLALSGTIVATSAIPEPESLAIFAFSGVILLRTRRSGRKVDIQKSSKNIKLHAYFPPSFFAQKRGF